MQRRCLLLQAVSVSEHQDAVTQQLTPISTPQVVQARHLLSSEARAGCEDQQNGMDASLRHGHGSGQLTADLALAGGSVKQTCTAQQACQIVGAGADSYYDDLYHTVFKHCCEIT